MTVVSVTCWRCSGVSIATVEKCRHCGAPNPGGAHGPAKMDKESMSETPVTPVKGYRRLSQTELDRMNMAVEIEEATAKFVRSTKATVEAVLDIEPGSQVPRENVEYHESMRQIALAKTHFEDAFMHLKRAVARPDSPWVEHR